MELFLTVCFGVGLGYTVIGFLIGEVFGLVHFHGDTDAAFDGATVSPIRPAVIAAFITVFGGVGLLLFGRLNIFVVLSIAALAALFIAYLLYVFVVVPLHKAQNTSTVEIQSLIGTDAKVVELIPQGSYGKISYCVNGNTASSPAKSENGSAILRNARVEIVSIENNTYYVKEK